MRRRSSGPGVGWAGERLEVSGTVSLTDHQPDSSPAAVERRFAELLPVASRPVLLAAMRSTRRAFDLVSETTGERWPLAAKRQGTGLRVDFAAEIDCGHAANGRRASRQSRTARAEYVAVSVAPRR